jgi:hypothetical protein
LPLSAAACASSTFEAATPEKQAEAERSYQACLASAAHYADDGKTAAPHLALIIAPMCYAQFTSLDTAKAAGFGSSARRKFEEGADDRQLAFAMAAVESARSRRAELGPSAPAPKAPQ